MITGPDGEPVKKIHRYLGRMTNNKAEYLGLIEGLREAKALGADAVDVFMDSELVVLQILGRYKVKHPELQPLHVEARQLFNQLPGSSITHVRRHLNAGADALANQALDEQRGL